MEPNIPPELTQPISPVSPVPQVPQPTVPTQVQTPLATPSNPKTPSRKTLYILLAGLILLILLAVGGGTYYLGVVKQSTSLTSTATLTSKPISTADWKTFVSSDNSFSIKAPSSWTVSKSVPSNPTADVNCLYLEGNNSILVSACYRYSTKFADSVFSKVPLRPDVKKTEINGYVVYNDKSLGLNDYYIIHPNGTFILITPGAKLDNDLFGKVVSTFQFAATITPSPAPTSDSTASWKTYSNNGYSIKYPATWTTETGFGVKNVSCIFLNEDTLQAMAVCSSIVKFSTIYPEYINNQNNPKITINGYDAYKDISPTGKGAFYIINSNEQFVNISPGTLSDMTLFDKILSTIKFTQ
jgi:hypothetical protein